MIVMVDVVTVCVDAACPPPPGQAPQAVVAEGGGSGLGVFLARGGGRGGDAGSEEREERMATQWLAALPTHSSHVGILPPAPAAAAGRQPAMPAAADAYQWRADGCTPSRHRGCCGCCGCCGC